MSVDTPSFFLLMFQCDVINHFDSEEHGDTRELPNMFQALMNLFRFRLLFVALYPGVHQFSLSAHAQAIYQKQPAGSKLLLILLDGFRHDYLDTDRNELPGFQKMTQMGVKAEYLIPEFPTLSYPNYYSIMTGEHAAQQ